MDRDDCLNCGVCKWCIQRSIDTAKSMNRMTTDQRGKLWLMCRRDLAFAVVSCESQPYEMMSNKLDAIAQGLANDIEAMIEGNEDGDDE